MQEVTRIFLENEMDVILAHKRSLRLAELAGISLSGQTAFATAVSELSRNAVEQSNNSQLILGIDSANRETEKFIIAIVRESDPQDNDRRVEGFQYAKRLVKNNITVTRNDLEQNIEIRFSIPNLQKMGSGDIKQWAERFENDWPASPYEEIKRKNRMLVDLADKLRASEQQYRSLAETLPQLIFSWNEETGLSYINSWTKTFTGATLEDLNQSEWEHTFHPDDYQNYIAAWRKRKNVPVKFQARLLEAETYKYIWHLGMLIPQLDEAGNALLWYGYCVDIHAQKLVEQTLKENEELTNTKLMLEANSAELQLKIRELNQSNLDLQQFASVASHDLQEPLRKMLIFSNMLKTNLGPDINKEAARYLERMNASSERMKRLISDILSYTKNESADNASQKTALGEILSEILEDYELLIEEKQATFDIGEMPVLNVSRGQIRQVFQNIISNALKFISPDVPPLIQIKSEYIFGDQCSISISDNGIGIDEIYKEKIFSLFQRLNPKDKYEGSGIGLAVVKKILERYNGNIRVDSAVGEGSTFYITLPCSP